MGQSTYSLTNHSHLQEESGPKKLLKCGYILIRFHFVMLHNKLKSQWLKTKGLFFSQGTCPLRIVCELQSGQRRHLLEHCMIRLKGKRTTENPLCSAIKLAHTSSIHIPWPELVVWFTQLWGPQDMQSYKEPRKWRAGL